MRGELAHDSKAHRYAAYGKCGACAPTVRDPYLGRSALHGGVVLMVKTARSCRTPNEPGARSWCPISTRANRHWPIRLRSALCS